MVINKKMLFAAWACNNKSYSPSKSIISHLKPIFKHFISFDPQEVLYMHGQEEMNKRLLRLVEKEKPDYIFLWMIYDEIYLDTLIEIRKVSERTKIINFFGDDDSLFDNYSIYLSHLFDYCLLFQIQYLKKYKNEGIERVFPMLAVNTQEFMPLSIEKEYDVSFIGTEKSDRHELVKYLKDNGIKMKLYGAGWEVHDDIRDIYSGVPDNDEYIKIINRSKINICLTKNYENKTHYKGRVLEIAACKSFSLVEYFSGYDNILKENREIVMFKDKKDLLSKIKYYLENEREREQIAERAYKKIVKNFSFGACFEKFFYSIKESPHLKSPIFMQKKDRTAVLSINEMELGRTKIKEILKDFEYVSFIDEKSEFLPYKNNIQSYGLEKNRKKISICDCYLHDSGIGDYLSMHTRFIPRLLKIENFGRAISLSQIVASKDYFMKNIDNFKRCWKSHNFDFINEREINFVSLPLVRINRNVNFDYEKMNRLFLPKFEDKLRMLLHENKLFFLIYSIKLLLFSLTNNRYIAKRMVKRMAGKAR